MSREPRKLLADSDIVAFRCKGDQWPRGLLADNPVPDGWMGLLIKLDGRRRFVPPGEDPRPDRDDTLVLVRCGPIAVPLPLADTPAADGHFVNGMVEVLLRPTPRDAELAALRATLLATQELTAAELAEAVRQAGAIQAVQKCIRACSAERLVHGDARDLLFEHLQSHLKRFLFSAGLLLERGGRMELASESLARQLDSQRTAARELQEIETRSVVEQAALAAARRRLDGLGDILAKLKEAATAEGGLRWRELLPVLTPGERGRLLESLWRLTPDQSVAEAIVAVTDREVVWLDAAEPGRIMHRVALPAALGGLRSVAYDSAQAWLLVGAASGVWVVSTADRSIVASFAVPDAGKPTTGFNAAVVSGGHLVATHSQLGCWRWPVEQPSAAQAMLRPSAGIPKTVRAATATSDGHVLFAADDVIHVLDPAGRPCRVLEVGRGAVHDIATVDRTLYVATSDGLVLQDSWDVPNVWQLVYRRSGPIESIHARRWDDLVELVIPANDEGVVGVYGDEGIVARLMTTKAPIRRAWACDDALLALSAVRDRLLMLSAAMPQSAGQEVPIGRMVGQLIQDACIVTRHEGKLT